MKYATLAAVIMAAFSSANIASASEGTITFEGELVATTCNVTVDGQGTDASVVLPAVGINQLASAGTTAGQTTFNIGLSNCEGTLNTATAFFESGTTVDSDGRLTNLGSATNVALQLRDGSSTNQSVIVVGNNSQTTNNVYGELASGSLTMPYLVEYYANAATTAGTVASNVTYSIIYK